MMLALLLTLVCPAFAAPPLELLQQGRVLDLEERPVEGLHDLTVELWTAPSEGERVWADVFPVELVRGYFAIRLGSGAPLDRDLFDEEELWVSIGLDGGAPIGARQQLVSVPYAIVADHALHADSAGHALTADEATSVSGGVVDATEIRVGGVTVIDEEGSFSGSLEALPGCDPDQILRWDDGWVCDQDRDAGGTITGVTAGEGLSGGGTEGAVGLAVAFDGTGEAPTAARSDHLHDGIYAGAAHDHEGVYAPDGHDHEGVYAPDGHDHDLWYADIEHGHEGVYATEGHAHDGIYAEDGHDHDADYAPIGVVPVGAVIDWWRPDDSFSIPAGYAVADGSVLDDPQSPLHGRKLPDLRGAFVRGADTSGIGATGGSASHTHTTDLPVHDHTVSVDHDHDAISSIHSHRWAVWDRSALQWESFNSSGNGFVLMDWSNGMDSEGVGHYPLSTEAGSDVHYYTERASISFNLPNYNVANRTTTPSDPAPETSSEASNLPPWVGLLKLVRVR